MLGQPSSMLIPAVVGCRLVGRAARAAPPPPTWCSPSPSCCASTASSASSSSSSGPAWRTSPIADRATLGNMCPEYGATVAIFPIDEMTLDYLRLTGRDARAGRAGRSLRARAGTVPDRRHARRRLQRNDRARPRRPWSRASPGRGVRRTVCRSAKAKSSFASALPDLKKGVKTAARRRRGGRDRHRDGARARLGRDRRDHQLHQYLEPERDDRRRARWRRRRSRRGCSASRGSRPAWRPAPRWSPTISRRPGLHRLPRAARVQPGRLRLHDVHRQQRPAARRDRRRRARARPGGGVGAERQPQLRRPHPAGRARQLSGVAAAGRRLRAGRQHERRPGHRAARARAPTARTST